MLWPCSSSIFRISVDPRSYLCKTKPVPINLFPKRPSRETIQRSARADALDLHEEDHHEGEGIRRKVPLRSAVNLKGMRSLKKDWLARYVSGRYHLQKTERYSSRKSPPYRRGVKSPEQARFLLGSKQPLHTPLHAPSITELQRLIRPRTGLPKKVYRICVSVQPKWR